MLVQREKVGLDLSGTHQVDAGEEHTIDVQQRLYPRRVVLLKQVPLGGCETEVMVAVVVGVNVDITMTMNVVVVILLQVAETAFASR